ncbi:hypothetical protein ACOBR2_06415 [Telmatobacter bradus]|uniref:hypothetical protein n=1 Tax=Telmatobacter bradus TaxID=474953 RepID=UPI003B42EA6C
MAWVIASGITDSNTDLSLAGMYFKIQNVQVDHTNKHAMVTSAIYASEAARTAGKQPYKSPIITTFGDACTTSTEQFTAAFAGTIASSATTPKDALLKAAYAAIQTHPDLSAMLTGATDTVA